MKEDFYLYKSVEYDLLFSIFPSEVVVHVHPMNRIMNIFGDSTRENNNNLVTGFLDQKKLTTSLCF